MIKRFTSALMAAASFWVPASASAQLLVSSAPLPAEPSGVAAQASVAAYYSSYSIPPLWFRGGVASPAVAELQRILHRAPFDGFRSGPYHASLVQAAVRQAASGRPADLAAAEITVSTAWVAYVQAMRKRTPGMIYAYPVLAPQGIRTDQILMTAAAAPSLQSHLVSVANANPIYAQIRDTAFAQAQTAGMLTPDPRLLANLDRARSLPVRGKYILVDAGSQRLWMYENGQAVDSMKVIVGTPELPTPLIASIMHYVTLNPYWNVPHHLVRKTIAPNVLSRGLGYLKTSGYEVMADWTEDSAVLPSDSIDWKAVAAGKQQIRVRQKPGPTNSMGKMKFPFPSGQDIYLHDTPNKALFAKSERALSNGCVRLEDARRLGRWLLGREPDSPTAEPEVRVQLPEGVPIYLTYLTAQPKDGSIVYASDVYGWDGSPSAQVASGSL